MQPIARPHESSRNSRPPQHPLPSKQKTENIPKKQTGGLRNEILFTGRRLDPETGLQLNRNRFYHPQLGRWVSVDPILYAGGMNLYQYVRGMPLASLDPLGLKTAIKKLCGKFVWRDYSYEGRPGWKVDFDPKGCGACKGRIKLTQSFNWDGASRAHLDIKTPKRKGLYDTSKWKASYDISDKEFPGYYESGFCRNREKFGSSKSAYAPKVDYVIKDAPKESGFYNAEYSITICAVCVDNVNGKETETLLGCFNFRRELAGDSYNSHHGGFFQTDDDDEKNGIQLDGKGNGKSYASTQGTNSWTKACECWDRDSGHSSRGRYKDDVKDFLNRKW